jgi:hypothetical protein
MVSPVKLTIWQLVDQCAQELTEKGLTPFSRGDLVACIQRRNPQYDANSINPIIQGVTDNLKGGPPGAAGKTILHSVARGQFVLNDKRAATTNAHSLQPSPRTSLCDHISDASAPSTEDELRDLLMANLYKRFGKRATFMGVGSKIVFEIDDDVICEAERPLQYSLPNGVTLAHKSDILISDKRRERYISIELKYKSAVTDQFKCRAYDIHHLKQHYRESLHGIMLFAKAKSGISIKQAKAICYQFDEFFGAPIEKLIAPKGLEPLYDAISRFLESVDANV